MTVILSFLSVYLWAISMIGNYYLNPERSWRIAAGLLIVNFMVSVILVKFTTSPLRPFIKALSMVKLTNPFSEIQAKSKA
ncbi:MAG: hypothetical protein HC767_10855 [Akkermansiaceae bacterium]|nr:hypothetical protein [Akkermansiaceae bacterium]